MKSIVTISNLPIKNTEKEEIKSQILPSSTESITKFLKFNITKMKQNYGVEFSKSSEGSIKVAWVTDTNTKCKDWTDFLKWTKRFHNFMNSHSIFKVKLDSCWSLFMESSAKESSLTALLSKLFQAHST